MTSHSKSPALPKVSAQFRPPPVPAVTMNGFWASRIQAVREKTIPILRMRCDSAGMFDQIDPTRPVPALRLPFHRSNVTSQMYWDSDVAKVLEAAAYALASHRDPALEEMVDQVVDMLAGLQQDDGYLSSWYTRMQPGKRWTNLRDCHELYCAGHLMEAAVAYFQATRKRKFLDVMCRFADHIGREFGPGEGQKKGYCGHEEIELALVKLARATGEARYLDLSRYFVEQRGQEPHYFTQEAITRGENPKDYVHGTYEYSQSHKPVREQDKVVGHAVRAMYLYSAMADLATEFGDASLKTTLERLWTDLVTKSMYVTGGIGPSQHNEGFTADYDLPNETAYAETCAAIGLAFWASRMLGLGPDTRYADVMERAIYNGILSGISQDGSLFFYENPLESRGKHNRWVWHRCPCCPPNIARLVTSIGTYAYGVAADGLAVHLYDDGEATLDVAGAPVRLRQKTGYPWDGRIEIEIDPGNAREFEISLRIPGWCRRATLTVNGTPVDLANVTQRGYARVCRTWQTGDRIILVLEMPVERVFPNPAIRQDVGRVAIMRGPILYCLEGVDNVGPLNNLSLPADTSLEEKFEDGLLGGIVTLTGKGLADDGEDWGDDLYRNRPVMRKPAPVKAVPYFAWDNRDKGEMLVWIREG